MTNTNGVPLTAGIARELAVVEGVCVRPVMRTVTDRLTGARSTVAIACGSTRVWRCPPCAQRARVLRMQQCAEGWHLEHEPTNDPGEVGEPDGDGAEDPRESTDGPEEEPATEERRVRSTRRRQDAPDLPRVPMQPDTIGRAFRAPSGALYRPSMFVTLTLPSYGPVVPGRGVPVDPARYDYRCAALDALHFPKLIDRWVQNLRRCAGYKVQYFAAIEAQCRLAPHLHTAIRGAIPRATLKAVTRATYAQVWWPSFDEVIYPGADPDRLPWWDEQNGCYRCPHTGLPLPTWDQALARLDAQLEADPATRPVHVVRFGTQIDVQGIIAPSPQADRAMRYLTKYLAKSLAATHTTPNQHGGAEAEARVDYEYEAHIDRLHAELRYLPCTSTCANWLRYGVTLDHPSPGLTPGRCPGPAHDRENLGLGGRRVLVSRQWSGKTLTEHRADRASVVRQTLTAAGIDAPETHRCAADVLHTDGRPRFTWTQADVHERDYAAVVLAAVAQRRAWRAQYQHAKNTTGAGPPEPEAVDERSATPSAAIDAA